MLIHRSITLLFNNWSKMVASIFDRQQSEGAMPLKFAEGVRVVAQPDYLHKPTTGPFQPLKH
jgi:hypothetical protein